MASQYVAQTILLQPLTLESLEQRTGKKEQLELLKKIKSRRVRPKVITTTMVKDGSRWKISVKAQ